MRRAALVAIALCAAIAAAGHAGAPAAAQDPVAPIGDFGGGAVPDPPRSPYGGGALTISLRALGNQTLQVRARFGSACERVAVNPSTAIAADGSFAASGTLKKRLSGKRRLRMTYALGGSINAVGASGSASATIRISRAGRTRTCTTGTILWGAARASGAIGIPGAIVANAPLYGTTTQRFGGRAGAIVLRISADGKRLTRALYDQRVRCGGRTADGFDAPRRNLAIAADGRVVDVERYRFIIDRRTRVRTRERFTATIGDAGASGTYSSVDQLIDRRTGRKRPGGCRSGTIKWTAARP